MKTKIVERSDLSHFVSPRSNDDIPIHNWFLFKHGYSKELVLRTINELKIPQGSWVLDPFCGSGTTMLTCKESGINSQGFDILPFSVFLSNVKIKNYNVHEIQYELDNFVINLGNNHNSPQFLPDIPIVNKAFQPAIRKELLCLKEQINNIKNPTVKAFFNLGFLNILESVSNTSKSGGFLRIIQRDVSDINLMNLYLTRINIMINDLKEVHLDVKRGKVTTRASLGDARKLATKRKFDAIITSPPYPNRHDYTRIYSLEMVFDFVNSNDELKQIRYDTLRSHVEAKKKFNAYGYKKPQLLDDAIVNITKNGMNNPQIINMLEGYFEDMYLVLSEMHRCLKPTGKIAMTISNVRFAGVNILVDEIMAELGAHTGLNPKEILSLRHRGNSSQQMRDYKRIPSRESIIIFNKPE